MCHTKGRASQKYCEKHPNEPLKMYYLFSNMRYAICLINIYSSSTFALFELAIQRFTFSICALLFACIIVYIIFQFTCNIVNIRSAFFRVVQVIIHSHQYIKLNKIMNTEIIIAKPPYQERD